MERCDTPRLAAIPYLENGGKDSIYEAIGVEPIINCHGTFTAEQCRRIDRRRPIAIPGKPPLAT